VNINNKLILGAGLFLIFLLSSIISSKLVFQLQDLGQLLGLGGVAVGYFGSKFFKKKDV
jgi:hypothetical protein